MNDSKHFSKERISTCDIAGAVALCAIRDLRVNFFRFGGFPQITVKEVANGFNVRISLDGEQSVEDFFLLTRAEALNAAKAFRRGRDEHDAIIFERVQQALARVVG